VQQLYARQPINNTAKNLEDSVLSWYGEEPENLHRSDEDAYNTMRILKAIAEYHNTDLAGILEMYPECGGEAKGAVMEYAWKKPEGEVKKKRRRHRKSKAKTEEAVETAVESTENYMERGSRNAELFVRYLANMRPKKTRKPPLLSGHTVTVSLDFQRYHFNEMLYLVQMIVNAGGRYTLITKDADTLYTYGNSEEDTRLATAKAMQEAGEEIEIYPIKILFDLLETGELKLSRKPKMDLSAIEATLPALEEQDAGENATDEDVVSVG
jgi:hypothetical protein